MSNTKELQVLSHAERMSDAIVRVERMFWIPGLGEPASNDFDEFVEDDLVDAKSLLAALPWLSKLENADDVLSELAMRRVDGFFVQLATPIPSSFHEGGGFSFSWGSYRTEWFYAKSVDKIPELAAAFSKGVIDAARARRAAKSEAAQ